MGFEATRAQEHQCASVVVVPPSSGLISSSLDIASWTCFDPSLINNLITPRPRQLSTRPILVSHHRNIAPPSGFRLARSRYAPTIRMRGTNVNTTPQSTVNGQNERHNGRCSTKDQAGCEAKLNPKRKDADA